MNERRYRTERPGMTKQSDGLPATVSSTATREEQQAFDPLRSVGMRWLATVGVDHAFALRSTLVSADFAAERFAGLFAQTDLSAEIGLRRQVTPQFVVDIGVTRHFVGLFRSNAISFGAGIGVPTPFIPKSGGVR